MKRLNTILTNLLTVHGPTNSDLYKHPISSFSQEIILTTLSIYVSTSPSVHLPKVEFGALQLLPKAIEMFQSIRRIQIKRDLA